MNRFRRLLRLLPVFAALATVSARADIVLISTLGEPDRIGTDGSPIANPQYWAAQEFRTDGASHLLSSIQAWVGDGLNNPFVVAELRAATVLGEIDLTPSGLIDTFTVPDVSGTRSARTFTPLGLNTLAPNTNYWFELGVMPGVGTFNWMYIETSNYTGIGSIPVVSSVADSSDGGVTFVYHDLASRPYKFQVNVSSVPEPGSLTLALIGLGGAALLRRRLTASARPR